MTEDKRIVSGENLDASEQADLTLRPKTLKTYIGQEKNQTRTFRLYCSSETTGRIA